MRKYNVAVVGATGAVGREMVATLEKHKFPVEKLSLFASKRSKGKSLKFRGKDIVIEELSPNCSLFKEDSKVEIAIFSAGSGISKEYAPKLADIGTYVIDNSSAWRMDPQVPLVVPEVNPHTLEMGKRIIANPNCSTIQLVQVLFPIHTRARIKRIVVSTYQAVSGAGQKAINELKEQIKAIDDGKEIKQEVFPYQIAYNCLPQIDIFLDNGYTKEEIKMVSETRKIMGDDTIGVTATCVRVPVFRGHSESVNIQTEKDISPKEIRAILKGPEGVVLVDNPKELKYPMPIHAEYREETFVGRIRKDDSIPNGINLWIVSDNLLKGAALNAVQIAEKLIEEILNKSSE